MYSGADLPIVLGTIGTLVAGFFGIAKVMLNQASRDRESDRKERIALGQAIKDMASGMEKVADSNEKIAEETAGTRREIAKGNKQSEERNGHLGELVVQGTEATKQIAEAATKQIIDTVQHVTEMHVDVQTIDKQVKKD